MGIYPAWGIPACLSDPLSANAARAPEVISVISQTGLPWKGTVHWLRHLYLPKSCLCAGSPLCSHNTWLPVQPGQFTCIQCIIMFALTRYIRLVYIVFLSNPFAFPTYSESPSDTYWCLQIASYSRHIPCMRNRRCLPGFPVRICRQGSRGHSGDPSNRLSLERSSPSPLKFQLSLTLMCFLFYEVKYSHNLYCSWIFLHR